MRRRLPIIVFAIAALTLLFSGRTQAQQSANNSPKGNESAIKPCIVVFGAVRSPARIAVRRRIRLVELLAIAGGVTERAGGTIQLTHTDAGCFQGEAKERVTTSAGPDSARIVGLNLADLLRGDEKANPYIDAGDVVIVTGLDPVYIAGNVVNPQAIYPKSPVTLLQAIRLAGGVTTKMKIDKVVIYRFRPNHDRAERISLDPNEIRNHRSQDPILEPYDIVDVGGSGQLVPGNRYRYPIFDSRPLIPLRYRFHQSMRNAQSVQA